MYVDELRHFVACVRNATERPLIDGPQGAAILALALAALRSSSEGRTIELGAEDETTRGWLSSLKTRA
jgi:predicted dehydrogenase